MTAETVYTIGLDLGQANDYTAISVLETQLWCSSDLLDQFPWNGVTPGWNSPAGLRVDALEHVLMKDDSPWPGKPPLHLRHLERWRGRPYPDIVATVAEMVAREPFVTCGYALVVDATGVGAPVVDLFRFAGVQVVAVTIHGGDAVNRVRAGFRVPKRELVASVQAVMQTGRLGISEGLDQWPTLKAELQNFKVKIDPKTAHDSYSHWREGQHDDLVLSLAMATWFRDFAWKSWDRERVQHRAENQQTMAARRGW